MRRDLLSGLDQRDQPLREPWRLFPVDSLPVVPRSLAFATPLWHGVELARGSTLGIDTAWGWAAHTGYLLLWCALGFWLALHRFRRRLAD